MSDADLAQLSDSLLSWTILVYALSLLGYAVENAFGRSGRVVRSGRTVASGSAGGSAGSGAARPGAGRTSYAGAAGGPPSGPDGDGPVAVLTGLELVEEAETVGTRAPRRKAARDEPARDEPGPAEWFGRIAVGLTVVGAALNLAVMVTRGLAADRVPWGNMYEFAVGASFVGVVVWLVVLVRSGQQVRRLGGFVILPVLLLLGLASLVLYVPAGPLVPALNSSWLKIHVLAAVIATGTFLVSFVASILFLVRERHENPGTGGRMTGTVSRMGARLPDAERLDSLAYRTVVLAFPIWTFAVISGAIWAESAWGRYWNWDPKETWSAITWLVYAGYLHARATAGWSGRRAAWIGIVGFSTMLLNLFVINFVVSGLHSYA